MCKQLDSSIMRHYYFPRAFGILPDPSSPCLALALPDLNLLTVVCDCDLFIKGPLLVLVKRTDKLGIRPSETARFELLLYVCENLTTPATLPIAKVDEGGRHLGHEFGGWKQTVLGEWKLY